MAAEKMDIQLKKCITPEFRVSFPALFKPKSFKGQDPKYSVVMCFNKKTDLKEMKRAVRNALIEEFGPDYAAKVKAIPGFKMPFRDGAEKGDKEGYGPDVTFVTASCKQDKPPGLVNQRREKIIAESDLYAGCWARAELIAFVYNNIGRGVSFSLQNVQKVRDDKAFSGRKDASEAFEAIDDGSDSQGSYQGTDSVDSLGLDL